jgi:uncharacterized protein YbcV (DUF1398 family)
MSFPEIVGALINAGFDYYLPDGRALALPVHGSATPVESAFDAPAVQAAIREAQAQVPGYTYAGFCDKVKRAGCAGYLVSFAGRRVLYFARSGDAHTEHFPK